YISGSMSEGFGLTLMEAVGSGLPIIGFDVRYGNPTFIEDGRNGYLIPVNDDMDAKKKTEELRKAIVRLFTLDDMKLCHRTSYKKAEEFLTYRVLKKWKALIEKN
nr:glycosyltransferase [Lachnospiraceae bacterium]